MIETQVPPLETLLRCFQIDEKVSPGTLGEMLLGEGQGLLAGLSGEVWAQGADRMVLLARAQWRWVPLCFAVSAAERS